MINFKTINNIRIIKGIKVSELCVLLDIDKSTYSKWIHYKCEPSATKFLKLCEILEINIYDVLKP